jgi:site-specific DNA-cytosine methylase
VSDVFTVTARPVRVGALCAGYGGLELGLSLAGVDVALAILEDQVRQPV